MVDLSSITQMAVYGLSLHEAAGLWSPLIVFVIGVAIYSLFVFKFYRFLARRKIMKQSIKEYEMHAGLKRLLHGLEVIFLFPFIVFFWFFVMAMLITLISSGQSIESIVYISVAYVSAVRITAYYSDELSKDLAKLIPFALLALFLIDASGMSLVNPLDLIGQLFGMGKTLAYYLVFVIILELALRILAAIVGRMRGHRKRPKRDDGKDKDDEGKDKPKKMKSATEAMTEYSQ
jgi:hypothetical protein